jgi:hypothetical protein
MFVFRFHHRQSCYSTKVTLYHIGLCKTWNTDLWKFSYLLILSFFFVSVRFYHLCSSVSSFLCIIVSSYPFSLFISLFFFKFPY